MEKKKVAFISSEFFSACCNLLFVEFSESCYSAA